MSDDRRPEIPASVSAEEVYQRAVEQVQQDPPAYDVEAELGRLTDWIDSTQRPRPTAQPASRQQPSRGFWPSLPPNEQAAFAAAAQPATFGPGEVIWTEGQVSDHVLLIQEGWVKVSVERSGQQRPIAIRGPGDLIGERAALLLRKRPSDVVALHTVHALRMTIQQFAAFLSDHPHVLAVLENQAYERMAEEDQVQQQPFVPTSPARETPTPSARRPSAIAARPTPAWASQNCTILFADIAGFADADRTDDDRLVIRRVMWDLLREALEQSNVPWDACHREDRGDGALIVVPPEIPTAAVVDPMLARLAAGLRRHNRSSVAARTLRLRLALHIGPLTLDQHGVTGSAVVHTARLLDVPAFKQWQDETQADLAFISSPPVYESVIAHGPGLINPSAYQRVHSKVKDQQLTGWMYLSGAATSSTTNSSTGSFTAAKPADDPFS
ncbi:cyclic nucleotide-binding domain-containing protein [Actinomadura miaoliensis]|uniref:Cyclic nucleotide-binding domain-containing protein n=1 Tax=Actinomadura miaoliensis TaxID=430685 RepID=A0ABP7UVH3_9ACTN